MLRSCLLLGLLTMACGGNSDPKVISGNGACVCDDEGYIETETGIAFGGFRICYDITKRDEGCDTNYYICSFKEGTSCEELGITDD